MEGVVVLTKGEVEKATKVFRMTDLNENGFVDEEEMLQILPQVLGKECSEESQNTILDDFRKMGSEEGITCDQFIELLKHHFAGKIDEYLTTFGLDNDEKESFQKFRRTSDSRIETLRVIHNPPPEAEIEEKRSQERAKNAVNPEGNPNDVDQFMCEYGLNEK